MFHSARIKLTAWYLAIIMLVSLSFSFVIYGFISSEINRFAQVQRFRIERRYFIDPTPPLPPNPDFDLITEVRNRLILSLAAVNGTILILAGSLGYFLAGRTLNPISRMVDEQNRFISDASHELKTPITALKSAIEVNLRNKKLTLSQAKEIISDNLDDVNRLQLLAEGLLQLSFYQHSTSKAKLTQVSLSEIVATAIKNTSSLAFSKNIKITNLTSDTNFSAKFSDIVNLLVILIDNAIKYSPSKTKITISSQISNDKLLISLSDQGIGIDSKDIPHIFNRFYRADSARIKVDTGGYGLGLSIAKKIVEAHRGSISVQSQPKNGSTFTIQLPLS